MQPKRMDSIGFLVRVVEFFRRLWRRLGNTLFWLAMFLIGLYFLLQSRAFQNWAIQKITTQLSEYWQTRVEVRHLDIDLFDKLILEGFYVEDQRGDTLLMAEKLTLTLHSGLFELFGNALDIREIGLKNAFFDLKRLENEEKLNLQFILDSFPKKKKDPTKKPAPYSIAIQNLNLQNVRFRYLDEVKGLRQNVEIPFGKARVRRLDLTENVIDIDEIALDGLVFDWAEILKKPLSEAILQKMEAAKKADPKSEIQNPKSKKPLVLKIKKFDLQDGHFSYNHFRHSPEKTTVATVLDTDHLDVSAISMRLDSVETMDGRQFFGRIRHFSAREQCGFELQHFDAKVALSDTLAMLTELYVKTPKSELTDSFSMSYERYGDFLKFNNAVKMDARLKADSRIAFSDLAHFNGALERNTFFKKNRENVAEIDGRLFGTVNDLRGRTLHLKVGAAGDILADFRVQNLSKSSNAANPLILNFKFKKLATDMKTLRDVMPGFSAPLQFDKLGKVLFIGELVGFAKDFVVNGDLATDLGAGKADMKLNLNAGRDSAIYSGSLDLGTFDLGRWLGRSDFGKISMKTTVANGNGLTTGKLKLDLSTAVRSVVFNNYEYKNLSADGKIDGFYFRGKVAAADPNLTGSLRGTVNFQNDPTLDLNGEILRADLKKLHFSDRSIVVSGYLDRLQSQGKRLDDLVGAAVLKDIIIKETTPNGELWSLPFAQIASEPTGVAGEKKMFLKSTLGDLSLEGKFKPEKLDQTFLRFFERFYPEFSKKLGLKSRDSSIVGDEKFRFAATIFDSKNFQKLVDTSLLRIQKLAVVGTFDHRGFLRFTGQAPRLGYQKHVVEGLFLDMTMGGSQASGSLVVDRTIINGKDTLAPIDVATRINRDTLHFGVNMSEYRSVLKNIFLAGDLFSVDSVWQVEFEPSNLTLLGDQWWIDPQNFIRFGKNFLRTKNFQLRNGDRVVSLDSKEGSNFGLIVGLNQFSMADVHRFWNYRKVKFEGNFEVWAEADNVFNMTGLKFNLASTDQVLINKKNYGTLDFYSEMADLDDDLKLSFNLMDQQKGQQLQASGAFRLPFSKKKARKGELQTGEMDLKLKATKFPAAILETFISGISKTDGTLRLDGRLSGKFPKIDLEGEAVIEAAKLKIDYLGTGFSIREQHVAFNRRGIFMCDTITDAVGILRVVPDTILDSRGRAAVVVGGLWHEHFRKWRIDIGIDSDDFLALNTTSKDNQTYYGTGIGAMSIVFGGDFSNTDISITATTGAGTKLAIPITSSEDAGEVRFIKFVDKTPKKNQKAEKEESIYGLNLDMRLTMTPVAEVQLIFDEAVGDVIKGRGAGDLQLAYNSTTGAMTMFGDYTIEKGEYLFTYFAATFLNVSKPFSVLPGGTIQWLGDPYGAILNLEAEYRGLQTQPYNLVADEVEADPTLAENAKQSTRVKLKLGMTGELFHPEIRFDIEFPDLQGSIRTTVDNALRVLRQDPNEMNRQVFGLIVVGSFLPSSQGFVGGGGLTAVGAAGVNTLTQFLSSQLSNHLSSIANTFLADKGISNVDFNVGYNLSESISDLNKFGAGELAIRVSTGIGSRTTVSVGTDLGVGGVTNGFLGEDVVLEILLSKDRKWRFRALQRTENNQTLGGGIRSVLGIGLSYRREFDSFEELLKEAMKE